MKLHGDILVQLIVVCDTHEGGTTMGEAITEWRNFVQFGPHS